MAKATGSAVGKKSSEKPLYLQMRDRLQKIVMKKATGENLPQERELAQEWGVSRITIRNAYIRLVEEGSVLRAHKAYKVAPHVTGTGLFMLDGFTKDALKRGNQPKTEVVGIELVYPPASIAQALLLPARERVYRLTRRRFLNNKMITIEYAHIGESLTPGLDRYNLNSLYDVLREQYDIVIHWAEQSFNFCFDRTPEYEQLAIDGNLPMLRLKRISFSRKNKPIEFVEAFYNIRDFEFYVKVRR